MKEIDNFHGMELGTYLGEASCFSDWNVDHNSWIIFCVLFPPKKLFWSEFRSLKQQTTHYLKITYLSSFSRSNTSESFLISYFVFKQGGTQSSRNQNQWAAHHMVFRILNFHQWNRFHQQSSKKFILNG